MSRYDRRYWVSWEETKLDAFEYHGPWWISGSNFEQNVWTICAAVVAESAKAAEAVVCAAFDHWEQAPREFRFVSEKAPDWDPFCDRFPRRDWMQWPWPVDEVLTNQSPKETT